MNNAITFSLVIFLSSSEVSVLFDIPYSHTNANLPHIFFACKYSLISHFSYYNCNQIWQDFTCHLYKNSNRLILHTHTSINYDSIFALDYIYFHLIYIYTCMIDAELKMFHLALTT